MNQSEEYRKAFLNKTDDQIIESLGNEVKDKKLAIREFISIVSRKDEVISAWNNRIELLLENYKTRFSNVSDIITSTGNNGSENDIKKMERLKTKQSEYRTFISELERTLM